MSKQRNDAAFLSVKSRKLVLYFANLPISKTKLLIISLCLVDFVFTLLM